MAAGVAQLVGRDAMVAGRVADVVAEAVEQAGQVAGRVAGGVLVGPGGLVLGGAVLRGGRGRGAGRRRVGLLGLLGPRAAPAEAEVLPELLAVVLPELAELLGQ